MAVPSYTEDLTDLTLCEAVTGFTALGGGASGLGTGADFAIQGPLAVDKQITGAGTLKGMMWDNGSTITLNGEHIFLWIMAATPGIIDTFTNGGKRATIGTATTAYVDFYLEGSDTRPEGGNKAYAIDYVNTAQGTDPKRVLTGTPGANPQWFGCQLLMTAAAKAANLGVDAIRRGTGAYITAGSVADGKATFGGFATQNDAIANKWGILTAVPGGFSLQGRFVIGQDNSKTPAACEFADSNKNIFIENTLHAAADFTQIIVDHASTVLDWTNISIIAVAGAINPGRLVFNNATTVCTIVGGTYTNIGVSTLRAGCTFTGTTWRTTGIITQNGATLTDGFFAGSTNTHHILSDNPSLITGGTFTFGSGHAVRCDTVGTYTWTGNTDTGYTGTRGSNLVSSSGSTDAMFYNNSGGLITLNVGGGGDAPSVRNGAGATTQVNANVTVTFDKMKDNTEVRVYEAGTSTELAGIENATAGTADNRNFAAAITAGTSVDYTMVNNQYEIIRVNAFTWPSADQTINIQQRVDRNYSNPA